MKIKIKEIRMQKEWSISKLSIKSGIAKGYISEIETGKYKNPSIKVLCNLCNALGCTLNDLVDCKEDLK